MTMHFSFMNILYPKSGNLSLSPSQDKTLEIPELGWTHQWQGKLYS